jgi:hypothetical protein
MHLLTKAPATRQFISQKILKEICGETIPFSTDIDRIVFTKRLA